MKFLRPYSIFELGYFLNADLIVKNNSFLFLKGLSNLFYSTLTDVVVLSNIKFFRYLNLFDIGLLVVKLEHLSYLKSNVNCLLVDNPRLALAKLSNLCLCDKLFGGISKRVVYNSSVKFGSYVTISDYVVFGTNVILGANTFICSGVTIGNNCFIGKNCYISSGVVIHDNVHIGNRCFIGSNSTIGGNGFGFVKDVVGLWNKICHFSGVFVGDDVFIGSNTSVDRGVFVDTIVSDGVLLDNQIQIAHNVYIGRNTAIAGCVGVGGSTYIGADCLIGGGVKISNHLFLSDRVFIAGASSVTKSIKHPGLYSSVFPVVDSYMWNKLLNYFYKFKFN